MVVKALVTGGGMQYTQIGFAVECCKKRKDSFWLLSASRLTCSGHLIFSAGF